MKSLNTCSQTPSSLNDESILVTDVDPNTCSSFSIIGSVSKAKIRILQEVSASCIIPQDKVPTQDLKSIQSFPVIDCDDENTTVESFASTSLGFQINFTAIFLGMRWIPNWFQERIEINFENSNGTIKNRQEFSDSERIQETFKNFKFFYQLLSNENLTVHTSGFSWDDTWRIFNQKTYSSDLNDFDTHINSRFDFKQNWIKETSEGGRLFNQQISIIFLDHCHSPNVCNLYDVLF